MTGAQLVEEAVRRFEGDLERLAASPRDRGSVELIVRRPREDEREVLEAGRLDPIGGLEGDDWATDDGNLDAQVTLMNVRVLEAIEPDRSRWPLAGDQLYVAFDLSIEALPAGSRLEVGEAVVELTAPPHTGCAKFSARFGGQALRWINSPIGRAHRMRGANARVVAAGVVRVGDTIRRV